MRVENTRSLKNDPLDDDELQQLIADRIDEDPVFWTGGRRRTVIAVEVEDGHVTLKGVVRSASDRRRADLLARSLGATSVDNRLRIGEEPQKPEPRNRARNSAA